MRAVLVRTRFGFSLWLGSMHLANRYAYFLQRHDRQNERVYALVGAWSSLFRTLKEQCAHRHRFETWRMSVAWFENGAAFTTIDPPPRDGLGEGLSGRSAWDPRLRKLEHPGQLRCNHGESF